MEGTWEDVERKLEELKRDFPDYPMLILHSLNHLQWSIKEIETNQSNKKEDESPI